MPGVRSHPKVKYRLNPPFQGLTKSNKEELKEEFQEDIGYCIKKVHFAGRHHWLTLSCSFLLFLSIHLLRNESPQTEILLRILEQNETGERESSLPLDLLFSNVKPQLHLEIEAHAEIS
jgi:hypothetical protein